MDIGALVAAVPGQKRRLADARAALGSEIPWYPYDILGNLRHLDLLLKGEYRDLDRLAGGLPVADIGGADGDLAFVLEQECGWKLEMIDTAPTNMNRLRAARSLREQLQSTVEIHDIDLDSQFRLPSERYGLVFLLGILYHLQNPYFVLRELSECTNHLLLSTRVARFAGPERTPIADLPVAYLVGPAETNNDATNYWMFSPTGLAQIAERAGWRVLEQESFGDVNGSDPSSPEHDERRFLLLQSRTVATGAEATSAGSARRPAPDQAAPAPSHGTPGRRQTLISASARLRFKARQLRTTRSRSTSPAVAQEPAPAAVVPGPGVLEHDATQPPLLCWPLDHFYSPVPDNRALRHEPARSRVWPPSPRPTPGIDWREDDQESLLRDHLGRQPELVFPDRSTGDPRDYHTGSEMFSRLDAWMLQGILRHFQPRRMIEVGCGWSSLVTARVNREYLGGSLDFTCIEPYPPDFLEPGVEGISRLLSHPVQDIPIETFLELQDGDVLFIDSSHTVKTGGDVTFLVEDVIPRLSPGVVVHFHDMFLPRDYPEDWVFSGRAWNEQYLVRSFLAFNSAFQILLSIGWLSHFRKSLLKEVLPNYPDGYPDGGGSLWIRRNPSEGV
jgi:tRNA (mo5U34)-methyltransferase